MLIRKISGPKQESLPPVGSYTPGCKEPSMFDQSTSALSPVTSHLSFPDPTLDIRFWSYVRVAGDCWLWTSAITKAGYGEMNYRGRVKLAHRLTFRLYHGIIPAGLFVCHDCDKAYPPGDLTYRRCVNPSHLFLGTPQDNTDDMVAKNRQRPAFGERIGNCKLSTEQVSEIRRRWYRGDATQTQLGKEYGVHTSWISRIVRMESRNRVD